MQIELVPSSESHRNAAFTGKTWLEILTFKSSLVQTNETPSNHQLDHEPDLSKLSKLLHTKSGLLNLRIRQPKYACASLLSLAEFARDNTLISDTVSVINRGVQKYCLFVLKHPNKNTTLYFGV